MTVHMHAHTDTSVLLVLRCCFLFLFSRRFALLIFSKLHCTWIRSIHDQYAKFRMVFDSQISKCSGISLISLVGLHCDEMLCSICVWNKIKFIYTRIIIQNHSQTNLNNPNFTGIFRRLFHFYCIHLVWWCICTFPFVFIFYLICYLCTIVEM